MKFIESEAGYLVNLERVQMVNMNKTQKGKWAIFANFSRGEHDVAVLASFDEAQEAKDFMMSLKERLLEGNNLL